MYYTYYYCLPSSHFCEEWSHACWCCFFGNLLLNGDFHFHVNYPSDSTASQFLDLFNCFNLDIFNLCNPTHKNNKCSGSYYHKIRWNICLKFTSSRSCHFSRNVKLTAMTRKLCNIDSDSLCTDIRSSFLYNLPSLDLSKLCDQYDFVLSSILDKHAPWYSEEIKEQKVICRRLQRRWRRSRLTSNSDYQSYTDQRTVVKNTIFTILAFSIQLKVTAKPCFAQLLVLFTG